jgi:putative Mn2+ efflux pump MntP
LLGFSPVLLAILVAVMSSIFLTVGMKVGMWFSGVSWLQRLTFLPGILLIIIGIWKM